MTNYWFRICFERDFESPTDAQDYLDEICIGIEKYDGRKISTDLEEK